MIKKFLLIFFLNILLNSCCIPDLRPCDGYNFFPSKSYDFLIKSDDFLKVENDFDFKFSYSSTPDVDRDRLPFPSCSSGCNTGEILLYYIKNNNIIKIDSKNRPKITKIFLLNLANKFIVEIKVIPEYFESGKFSIGYLPNKIDANAVIEIETEKGILKYVKQRSRKDFLQEYYKKSN